MEHYTTLGRLEAIYDEDVFRIALDIPGESMTVRLGLHRYVDPDLNMGDAVRLFSQKHEGLAPPEHVALTPAAFPDIFDDRCSLSDFLHKPVNEQALIVRRNLLIHRPAAQQSSSARLRFRMAPQARSFYEMTRHTYTEAQTKAIEDWLARFGEDGNRSKLETLMGILPDAAAPAADIAAVRAHLDRELWGMEEVKHQLLCHIEAAGRAEEKGAVFCLVGPPGTGKTALARALGEALGKPHIFQSCAGWTSSLEVLGANSTFNNASVGKLLESFARAGTTDVVFTLDELDKAPRPEHMGKDGSAHYSLLEVFSEGQVTDSYLGVPIQTANTIWIITCNSLRNLPDVLVNRCHVIEIPAYSDHELIEICRHRLLPRLQQKYRAEKVTFTDEAFAEVVRAARDAGARGTAIHLEKVLQEVLCFLRDDAPVVDGAMVRAILHLPKNREEHLGFVGDLPGAALMLGVSGLGRGCALPVETRLLPGTGLEITGLPDRSPELIDTVHTAMTVLQADYGFDLSDKRLHIHFGSAGSRKAGASAGLAMVLSLYSALIDTPLPLPAAATGEIDIYNHVFAVGSLMEKVEGACRMGARKVYVPADNLRYLTPAQEEHLAALPIAVVGVSCTKDMIADLYGKPVL